MELLTVIFVTALQSVKQRVKQKGKAKKEQPNQDSSSPNAVIKIKH